MTGKRIATWLCLPGQPTERGGDAIVRQSDLVRKRKAAAGPKKAEDQPAELPVRPVEEESPLPEGAPPLPPDAPPAADALTDPPGVSPYQPAHEEVTRIVVAASQGGGFSVDSLQRIVVDLVKVVAISDDLLVRALDGTETSLDLPRHLVNVAVLAIKIGQGVGLRDEELPWLGLAASLHDIGMVTVPRRILEKPGPLSPDEVAQLRRHPERGFQILLGLGPEFEWLANVALQEQEREDGSGYPKGLRGDQIHDYAKIVGLADVYEAVSHARQQRPGHGSFDVIKELLIAERQRFSDRVLKGIIRGLSAFPVGSMVRLNSRETARVVSTNLAFPLRPVVEVILSPKEEPLQQPRRVDLSADTLLYITDAFFTEAAR